MDRKQHWEQVYATKASDSVSWFQAHAEQSLRLIHNTGLGMDGSYYISTHTALRFEAES